MNSSLVFAGGGTGGHVFPMVAVADALAELAPAVHVTFVGTARGIETRVVPERGYALELLEVLPIRGGGVLGAGRGVARALGSIPAARALIRRVAPSAVFSIGGYAAGPVALAARSLGVPLALMEPNAVMGFANRVMAPFVARAYTAFAGAERHLSARVVLRSGVPLRRGFEPRPYARGTAALSVLVLGGSQGAKALNETVPRALAQVGARLRIVHQCGPLHREAAERLYAALGMADVEVVPFIEDVPQVLGAADLVIGRAGASTLSEICAVGRPSLVVPYPFAAGDHQLKNAEALAQAGAAISVPAAQATVERIALEVEAIAGDRIKLEGMAAAARALGRPEAARTVALDLLSLAGLSGLVDLEREPETSETPKPPPLSGPRRHRQAQSARSQWRGRG